ncbi:MAG TPA: phosphoribosylaminoimidazolesuccinocarboxamide synthase [Gammaproteobacteria bacterium]|nr:phosphoribosylaminoimidazolesuccinocarboxamide synthase [Gammaproteobacteria bacterium]
MSQGLHTTNLTSLPLLGRGKVRDLYRIDEDRMLIVTTDRLSAFDVVMPQPIPGKGRILAEISNFWFHKLAHIVPNHLLSLPLRDILSADEIALLDGRAIAVKKVKPLPVEAVVRGYLIGSGWKDYKVSGSVCGIKLPEGLRQASQLPRPIFTPATKAAIGAHDENISYEEVVKLIGAELAARVRDISVRLYSEAANYALTRGIIIADTKFEFGLDENGQLLLIDEALTPDSSRFWPVDQYRVDASPPSFDKQFVRDYLETLDWNKAAPGPELPPLIVQRTAEKYREALRRLTA